MESTDWNGSWAESHALNVNYASWHKICQYFSVQTKFDRKLTERTAGCLINWLRFFVSGKVRRHERVKSDHVRDESHIDRDSILRVTWGVAWWTLLLWVRYMEPWVRNLRNACPRTPFQSYGHELTIQNYSEGCDQKDPVPFFKRYRGCCQSNASERCVQTTFMRLTLWLSAFSWIVWKVEGNCLKRFYHWLTRKFKQSIALDDLFTSRFEVNFSTQAKLRSAITSTVEFEVKNGNGQEKNFYQCYSEIFAKILCHKPQFTD